MYLSIYLLLACPVLPFRLNFVHHCRMLPFFSHDKLHVETTGSLLCLCVLFALCHRVCFCSPPISEVLFGSPNTFAYSPPSLPDIRSTYSSNIPATVCPTLHGAHFCVLFSFPGCLSARCIFNFQPPVRKSWSGSERTMMGT